MFGNIPPIDGTGGARIRRSFVRHASSLTVTADGRPGGGPGPDTSPRPLFEALEVRRNARIGAVVGIALGVAAYLMFVVLQGRPLRLAALYVVSVVVVATATAVLVTVALVVRRLFRATVDARKWVRRGGTAALCAGALLAALALVGPLLGYVGAPSGVVTVYGWALPACAVGVLSGTWAVHAAHRSQPGYGRLGLVGAVVAGGAVLLTWWVLAIESTVFLARPLSQVSATALTGVLVALGAGTSLLGAATLRAAAMPRRGPLLALFTLPLALAGLTVAVSVAPGGLADAYLDPPAPPTAALATPVGVAWALLGADLRAGRGVPPAAAFGIDLVAAATSGDRDSPAEPSAPPDERRG